MKITQENQIIVGKRVRCLYPYDSEIYGKTGTIASRLNQSRHFAINWDDGNEVWREWYFEPNIFEYLEEENPTTKACSNCGCHNKFEVKQCWFCQKNPFKDKQ